MPHSSANSALCADLHDEVLRIAKKHKLANAEITLACLFLLAESGNSPGVLHDMLIQIYNLEPREEPNAGLLRHTLIDVQQIQEYIKNKYLRRVQAS